MALRQLFSRPGFVCINLGNFLDGLCYFGIVPLLTTFLQSTFHLADEPVGWIFSVYVGAVTLMMFPGGWLCDRLGSRRAMLLSLAVLGCGRSLLVAGGYVETLWLAVLGLLVMAFGSGIMQPTVYAGVKEYTEDELAAQGYSWLYSIMNLGSVLWMLVSPGLRHWGGIEGVYLVLTLVTWINLLLQLSFFRDPGRPRPAEAAPQWRLLLEARFLFFIFMLMPVRNLVAHLYATFPTYFQRVFPAQAGYLEWCFGLNYLMLFVGTPLLTHLGGARSVLGLMIFGSTLSALSLGCLVWFTHPAGVVAFLVLFSLGEAIWQARFYEYVAQTAPPGQVGAAMSLANFPWFLAKTGAGLYSGWMLHRFVPAAGGGQPQLLWAIYGLVALLTPLSLSLARGWLSAKQTIAPRGVGKGS